MTVQKNRWCYPCGDAADPSDERPGEPAMAPELSDAPGTGHRRGRCCTPSWVVSLLSMRMGYPAPRSCLRRVQWPRAMHRFLPTTSTISVLIIGALSGLGCGNWITSPCSSEASGSHRGRSAGREHPVRGMGQVDDDDEAADSRYPLADRDTGCVFRRDSSADGSHSANSRCGRTITMMVRSRSRSRSWTPEMRTPRRVMAQASPTSRRR